MNALSNHVLAVLFSWIRTLIQGIWSSLSFGADTGFWPWIGDHWLILIVLLCLICTVLDYFVWLIRWRPYVIWRQRMRRLFRRDAGDMLENDRDFRQGYRSSVALDLRDMQDSPAPMAWDAEAYAMPAPSREELPDIPAFDQIEYAAMEAESLPLSEDEPPFIPTEETPKEQTRARRRRSDRHAAPGRRSLASRIIRDEEDEGLSYELPPVVDKETAFHAPVYPQESPYSSWQRKSGQHMNG